MANKAKQVIKTVLTNRCSALQCVILDQQHMDANKFQAGDKVRVTVTLTKREKGGSDGKE